MNTKKLIVSAAMLIATGAAFAQQATEWVVPDANFVSTKTRAEVVAELKQAQTNGVYAVGGEEFPGQTLAANGRSQSGATLASGKTRAEVKAEVAQAQANGAFVVGGEEFPGQVAKNTYSRSGAIQSAGSQKSVSGVSGN